MSDDQIFNQDANTGSHLNDEVPSQPAAYHTQTDTERRMQQRINELEAELKSTPTKTQLKGALMDETLERRALGHKLYQQQMREEDQAMLWLKDREDFEYKQMADEKAYWNDVNYLLEVQGDLQEQNRVLQEQNATLQDKKRALREENKVLQEEKRVLQREKRVLQEEKFILQREKISLQVEKRWVEDDNEILKKDIATQDSNNHILYNKVEDANDHVVQLEGDVEELRGGFLRLLVAYRRLQATQPGVFRRIRNTLP
ncbi:WD repeat-containing protein [Apiospora arundinis]